LITVNYNKKRSFDLPTLLDVDGGLDDGRWPDNGVVSWEQRKRTILTNVLIGGRVDQLLSNGGLVLELGAVRGSDAVCVGGLEQSAVGPSHDEVTMKTISSRITIGKGKAVEVSVTAGVEKELVEEGEDGDRVGLGAHTTVVVSNCRVGNMAHVVWGVNVNTIPARGKVDLRPHEIASSSGEPWVLNGPSVVHAHDGNGTLCRIRVILSATV